jgi:hypothetical protein
MEMKQMEMKQMVYLEEKGFQGESISRIEVVERRQKERLSTFKSPLSRDE